MNELLNLSNEIPHLILPASCIHNSLRSDEHSINSFSSIRAGSVTVINKNFPGNCLSSETVKKLAKLPIPIQTISRIKKQNTQVKKMLKKSAKNCSNGQHFSPKIKKPKDEVFEKLKDKNSNTKSSARDESPKSFFNDASCALKFPLRLKFSSKKETKTKISGNLSGPKMRKCLEKQLEIDLKKLKTKMKTCKSKESDLILLTPRFKNDSKNARPKKKKEDESKSSSHKKLAFELSKIVQKSKTRQKLSIIGDSSVILLNKRSSESMIRQPVKTKSKKKLKKNENIFKDKKKIIIEPKKEKIDFSKPKRGLQKEIKASALKKTLEFLNSDTSLEVSRPNSDNRKIEISNFFSLKNKENSAILIQSHIRKYLAQKKYKRVKGLFSLEDNEVKNIISGWKKDSNDRKKKNILSALKQKENEFDTLQKLKTDEINQIKSLIRSSGDSNQMIETITKIINVRYQNIAKIMENKYESKNNLLNDNSLLFRTSKDPENLEFDRTENSDSFKDVNILAQITESAANTKDNSVTPYKGESEVQQLFQTSLEEQKVPLNPSPNSRIAASSQLIAQISEQVLQSLIQEELSKAKTSPKDRVFDFLLDTGVDFILLKFDKLEKTLERPLRKNPLEILEKVQSSYSVNPLKWNSFGFPNIFPPCFYQELSQLIPGLHELVRKNLVKMLLDCFNEIIQVFRPFGLEGAPMPWSAKKVSKIRFSKPSFRSFLVKKMRFFNSISAGKIPDSDFFAENKLDEERLNRFREEKIGVLVGEDLKKNEVVWTDYEFEETQSKVVLAEQIFEMVLGETIGIISQ